MDYYEINIRHDDYSFIRRAIRSNELFFVIDVKDIEPFMEKYLKNFMRSTQKTYKYN